MTKIIPITSGIGHGPTELAAFDDALLQAGIANYNLLYLSSIIPFGFRPKIEQVKLNHRKFGHKLYIVCAQQRTSRRDETVAAGIGWVMSKRGQSHGLFVEHEGHSHEEVQKQIERSLKRMVENRPEEPWGEIQHHVVSAKCTTEPVCALVAAVYQSERW